MPTHVSSAARRPTPSRAEEPAPHTAPPAPPRPREATTFRPSAAVESARAASVAEFARRAKPGNDDVLYVGLNSKSCKAEAGALATRHGHVTTIRGTRDTTVELGGRSFDLSSRAGIDGFTRALADKHGLPEATRARIGAVLAETPSTARDELAQIAALWAPGERGGRVPSRLVLSGHSLGHGDVHADGVLLPFAQIQALARALPGAAAQVEDIHLSACMTVGELSQTDTWTKSFPNLNTLWAYAGFAPNAPTSHLRSWDAATRGRGERLDARLVGANTAAVAWSRTRGLVMPRARLDEIAAGQVLADLRYPDLLSGTDRISRSDEERARDTYATYRLMSLHPDTPAGARAELGKKADQMLRIRFYESSVRGELQKAHGAELAAGYRALGLAVPDFSKLDRRAALRHVAAFEQAIASRHPPPPAAARVQRVVVGLRTLDREIIKDDWIH